MKPRGRRGSSDGAISLTVTVRLGSRPLARKLYQCSRGRGVSINEFVKNSIAVAVENPDPVLKLTSYDKSPPEVTPPIDAGQAVKELATSSSSDAFDHVSLSKLSEIAQAAGVSDVQAHRLIGLFIDAVR